MSSGHGLPAADCIAGLLARRGTRGAALGALEAHAGAHERALGLAAAPSRGALLSMPMAGVEEKAAERFSLALLAAAAAVACAAVAAKGHQ